MAKKSKPVGIDLRHKLTADFVAALQADWDKHGPEIIEALRTKAPAKYAEIVSRLAMPEPMPASPYEGCESLEDIGKALLRQVGLAEDEITESMISRAVEAHDRLVAELQAAAQDN